MAEVSSELSLFEALALDRRVDEYGTARYYTALGKLHRVHGPAVEYSDGGCAWFRNGILHRDDGPAVEYNDGSREWRQHGRRHRIDGPAVEYEDGTYEWYINGKELTEAEWRQAVASMEDV